MTKSNRFSLETFGPELMAALLHGSRRRLVIGFPSKRAAQHFMARIHRLRSAMKKAEHPDYPVAARARCSLWFKGTKIDLRGAWLDCFETAVNKNVIIAEQWEHSDVCFVVIDPHDSEFAGILSGLRSDPADLHHEDAPQVGDGFLSDLTKGKL